MGQKYFKIAHHVQVLALKQNGQFEENYKNMTQLTSYIFTDTVLSPFDAVQRGYYYRETGRSLLKPLLHDGCVFLFLSEITFSIRV